MLVVSEQQKNGKRDVQERPTVASSRSFYCRPGNPQALRRAQACDVQEQHDSGVQPELKRHGYRITQPEERQPGEELAWREIGVL